MNVVHFSSANKFRTWLKRNHDKRTELQVGFYNKQSGRPGMTYQEALDEALCFGWIDGVVRKIDDVSFTRRFTPRKSTSIWSNVNVAHVARLTKAGRMQAAGLHAFAARKKHRIGVYSFEQIGTVALSPALLKKFKANNPAWAFFNAQAPWYRRKIIHKINSSKKEATRVSWLDRAIQSSANQTLL